MLTAADRWTESESAGDAGATNASELRTHVRTKDASAVRYFLSLVPAACCRCLSKDGKSARRGIGGHSRDGEEGEEAEQASDHCD